MCFCGVRGHASGPLRSSLPCCSDKLVPSGETSLAASGRNESLADSRFLESLGFRMHAARWAFFDRRVLEGAWPRLSVRRWAF